MGALASRWEGSRGFMPAVRLAQAIQAAPPASQRDEEQLIGGTMTGLLAAAKPIVCPPEQLNAVPDDVFPDLGTAFEYACLTRLPFDAVFFDFVDHMNRAPTMAVHMVEGGGQELGFELRGVVAGENHDDETIVFLPLVGYPGMPPEELGAVFVDRGTASRPASSQPTRWTESITLPGSRQIQVTMMSVSAAMEALGEEPRPISGALMGAARGSVRDELAANYQVALAVSAATAFRLALKVIYLLDSVNVELAPVPVSRQVRRQAERKGAELAWSVAVRPPRTQEGDPKGGGSRSHSHRFEVRGNFAHHQEGSWLYTHSDPSDIRPCPRCGTCRRVWRPPHTKGPTDAPLVVKVRRIDFGAGAPDE